MSEERNNLPEFNLPGDDSPETSNQTNETPTTDSVEQSTEVQIDPNAKAIFDIYRDEGFITSEEFGGTYDSLREVLLKETQQLEDNVFKAIVESPPDFARPLVEMVLTKGNTLTKEELLEFASSLQEPSYSEDNLPSEQFLSNYYKTELGWDDDDINSRLEDLKDKEKLEDEAKRLFKKQNQETTTRQQAKLEEIRQQREQQKAQAQQFITNFTSTITENYQKPKAQKLYNEFTTGAFKQKLEDMLTKPEFLHQLVNFVSYYDGKKIDMETFKKEAFSPSTTQIQNNVQRYWSSNTQSGVQTNQEPGKKKIDLSKARFVD